MKYSLIDQIKYTMAVAIGNSSQYNYHKRKLPKWLHNYAKTIKHMNRQVWKSDYLSPWNQGPYDMFHELDFCFYDDFDW